MFSHTAISIKIIVKLTLYLLDMRSSVIFPIFFPDSNKVFAYEI